MVFAMDVTPRIQAQEMMAEQGRLAAVMAASGDALTSASGLQDGLQQCAGILVRHLDAALVRIWTLDDTRDFLTLHATAGLSPTIDDEYRRIPIGQMLIGNIAASRKPYLTNDVPASGWIADLDWARREEMVAFIGYPLIIEGRLVGVAAAFSRNRITEATVRAFQSVTRGIAQFIVRKRSEQALRASEERVRLLLDSYRGGAIYEIDLQGKCTLANLACLRMLGYPDAEALIGRNMHTVMHHSHADGSPYPIEQCRIHRGFEAPDLAHVDDEVLWRADGSSFPAESWSHPIVNRGEMAGAVVTFVDITDRKCAEQEQQKLLALIDSSEDLIGIALPDLTLRYVNRAGARMSSDWIGRLRWWAVT